MVEGLLCSACLVFRPIKAFYTTCQYSHYIHTLMVEVAIQGATSSGSKLMFIHKFTH